MATDQEAAVRSPGTIRRVVAGAAIGNFVEWFDFGVYAALTPIILGHFFPAEDRTAALLGTFAVFAVAFFARPVGGFVFGHLGDRIGRRTTLSITILIMAVATFAIGLMPGYASIGVLAPILLVIFRLLQGFAVGGEYMGAATFIVEYAPAGKRGFYASFVSASLFAGPLVAIALTAGLTSGLGDAAMEGWAWRIPFLLALPLGLIGLYLRLRFEDTPEFARIKAADDLPQSPIAEAFRTQWKRMAVFFGAVIANVVGATFLVGYLPTYLAELGATGRGSALLANAIVLLIMVLLCPVSGWLTDRYGRKPLLFAAAAAFVILSIPAFLLLGSGGLPAAIVGQLLVGLPVFFASGAQPLALVEYFSARVRYASGAITYGLVNMVFGGTGPLLVTALIAATGIALMPGYYLVVLGLVSAAVIGWSFKEPSHEAVR